MRFRVLGSFVAVTAIGFTSCSQPSASTEAKPTVSGENPVADGASDTTAAVTLVDATHEDYKKLLKKHEGQVVFVDFWATWCGNCMEEFPHTVALAEKHRDQKLAVVSVALELDPTDAATRQYALDFLTKKNATFENLIFTSDGTSDEALAGFDIDPPIPHFHLYDRSGKLIRKFTYSDPNNPISQEDIDKAVEEALAAK
jgi:thiol-disulfide isomerase/thioredoxin